jgi:hypothetical protein
MKSVVTGVIVIAAFVVGRYSVRSDLQPLPSVPVAFVQATQPIAVTIDVDLETTDAAGLADHGIHELKGSATYQFTNLTDKAVSMAFPPTRTFSISSTTLSRNSSSCPEALAEQQIVEIPANSSVSFTGPWSDSITGDLDMFLQAGAGKDGFTFAGAADTDCFSGTLIAFQTFNGVEPRNRFHTTAGHLELVHPFREP